MFIVSVYSRVGFPTLDFMLRHDIAPFEHRDEGINPVEFWKQLSPALYPVLNSKNVEWLVHAGKQDMGYMLRGLTGRPLPFSKIDFLKTLYDVFPTIYDTQKIYSPIKNQLSLTNLSDAMEVSIDERDSDNLPFYHQAGYDALLTLLSYYTLQWSYSELIEQAGPGLVKYEKPFSYTTSPEHPSQRAPQEHTRS